MEKKYGNKYEVACAILDKLKQGGTGGGKFTLVDGTKLGYSTFSTIPDYYDFSEVTEYSRMFSYCNKMTAVPQLDTSKCFDFSWMFYECRLLTTIPQIDTSNGTNFSATFYHCNNLTSVPPLYSLNSTRFDSMFGGCRKLTTIPQLNITNGTNLSYMFSYCTALENITFVGSINYSIDFSDSTLLTYDSIKSILTACAATTYTSSKTLKFKRTIADNNGELATLVGECTTKGWTIMDLTLE